MSAIVQLGEEDLALELSRLADQLTSNSVAAAAASTATATATASATTPLPPLSAEGADRNIGPLEHLALALKYDELFETAVLASYEQIHIALMANSSAFPSSTPSTATATATATATSISASASSSASAPSQVSGLGSVDWDRVDLFFCLALAVLERVSPLPKMADAARRLVRIIEASNSNPALTPLQHWAPLYVIRMRFAVNLFNALYGKARDVDAAPHGDGASPQLSFDLLGAALEALVLVLRMALESHNAALVAKQLKNVPVWLSSYSTEAARKLGVKPPADVYLLAYQIANTANQPQQEADAYLLSYLRAMNGAKADDVDRAIPFAQEAALRAISAPLESQAGAASKSSSSAFGASAASLPSSVSSAVSGGVLLPARPLDAQRLLSLDAIKALSRSSSSAHQLTWRLLSIFSQSKPVPAYLDFAVHSAGRDFLKAHSLDHTALLRKLRTLTLCRLALESERLPYSDVALHLGIPSGAAAAAEQMDVIEGAVIDAIQSGRLEARLDEETDSVLVKRVAGVHFHFAEEEGGEWKQLANKLASWKSNVTQVVTTLSLNPQQQSFETDGSEDI